MGVFITRGEGAVRGKEGAYGWRLNGLHGEGTRSVGMFLPAVRRRHI